MKRSNDRPRDGEIALAVRQRRARVMGADCEGARFEAELRRFDEWNPADYRETSAGDTVIGAWVALGRTRGHASTDAAAQAALDLATRRKLATPARSIRWVENFAVRVEERTCLVCGVDCASRCSQHPHISPRVHVYYSSAEMTYATKRADRRTGRDLLTPASEPAKDG